MKYPLIALWKKHPGDLLGEAIEFVTHGIYSHAGFIRGNDMVHELYLPKLRDRLLANGEESLIDFFSIEGMTDEIALRFEDRFDTMLRVSEGYSITDLFRIELNIAFPNDLQSVCSGYVLNTCGICLPAGHRILERVENGEASPRDIGISPRLIPDSI